MPARTRKLRHDDLTRQRIKVGNIINRLQKLINGEAEMAPHAVTAALGLLKKALPDLTSVEHMGDVTISKVIRSPSVADTAQSWAHDHIPQGMTEH